MRYLGALILGLSTSLPLVHAADNAPTPSEKPVCSSQSSGGDLRVFVCPIEVSGQELHFRFKVNFSGGHDDTMASMETSLDGAPLACENGSKTSLMGEDGDVSLECRLSSTDRTGGEHLFQATVSWSHAQYVGFEFRSR